MQRMSRGLVGLTFLLLVSAGPAGAMDQSATEETNCLMACDANQEHCATGHGSAGTYRPHAEILRPETRLARRLRPPANFSQIDRSTPPKERLH